MERKTCLITGANSGIGKEAAKSIASTGAHIIMVCRNENKGIKAKTDIIQATDNQNIDLLICDFSSFSQIRGLAKTIKGKYHKIDVLLNNAGFITNERKLSKDGYEITFAVNHLGYFLLTNLLLDKLKAADKARIINVSSEAHRFVRFDPSNLELKRGYDHFKAYSLSKLCNILFTNELAKRLKGTSITANSLHPGLVRSNFALDMSGWAKYMMKAAQLFAIDNKKGAETSAYLALSPEVEGLTGKYFVKKKQRTPSADARNPDHAQKLWEISEQMVGLD